MMQDNSTCYLKLSLMTLCDFLQKFSIFADGGYTNMYPLGIPLMVPPDVIGKQIFSSLVWTNVCRTCDFVSKDWQLFSISQMDDAYRCWIPDPKTHRTCWWNSLGDQDYNDSIVIQQCRHRRTLYVKNKFSTY